MQYNKIMRVLRETEYCREQLFMELKKSNLSRIKQDDFFKKTYEDVKKAADSYIAAEIPELPYSAQFVYYDIGGRLEFESKYFDRRRRLLSVAFMSIFDDNDKYIKYLSDVMWAICNEECWSVPAHLGENRNSKKTIDLTSGDTGQALSEIVSILPDKFDNRLKDRIKKEVFERIIEPAYSLTPAFNWELTTTNWTAVCAGSVGMSAIYCIDDSEILARVLFKILDSMEFYFDGFSDDGTCPEGVAYWSYGTTYFISFAKLLLDRTDGRINLFENPKMKNIANFISRIKLYGNTVVNFSDCGATFRYREGFLHKLKDFFPEVNIPSSNYIMPFDGDHCYRWCGFIRDIVWRKNEYRNYEDQNTCFYFDISQWYVNNRVINNKLYSFAAKGGHNGESHNHNDIGHFIYQIEGDTFFIDMGAGEYTKGYFGAERYDSIFANSKGHSLPEIDGKQEAAGEEYKALSFRVSENDNINVDIDLKAAYEDVLKADRKIILNKDGSIQLADEFSADKVIERFVISSVKQPEITDDGIILFGKKSDLLTEVENAVLLEIKKLDGFYLEEDIKKYILEFHVSDTEKPFLLKTKSLTKN